jgi:hypothetical protein
MTAAPRRPPIDYTRLTAATMTEDNLDATIRELAAWLGIRIYTVRNSKRGAVTSRGYPDLTIVGPAGIIWRELKIERGRLNREQLDWGRAISDAGGNWKVWRPSALLDKTVERELRELATPRPPETT